MAYTPEQAAILRKYTLIDDQGNPIVTDIKKTYNEKKLGPGPKMDSEVIDKLLSITDDPAWLDWIFYQAAGGKAAENAHSEWLKRVLANYQHKWITKRVAEGMPKAEAEAKVGEATERWRESYRHYLDYGDEAAIHNNFHLPPMAFFRHWPGGERRRYEKLYNAAKSYINNLDSVAKYNELHGTNLPVEPKKDLTPEMMEDYVLDVAHGLGAAKAKTDIRIGQKKPIYDDDYITVIVPITHAAAVRYGRPGWAWSDPEKFKELLKNRKAHDPWSAERNSIIAYLRFNVPVPSWRSNGRRYWLSNLALKVPFAPGQNPRSMWAGVVVHDEENRQKLTLDQVRERIQAEGERSRPVPGDEKTDYEDPSQVEDPIKVGAPVYDKAEASKIIQHFDAAVDALLQYASTLNTGDIERGFRIPLSKKAPKAPK